MLLSGYVIHHVYRKFFYCLNTDSGLHKFFFLLLSFFILSFSFPVTTGCAMWRSAQMEMPSGIFWSSRLKKLLHALRGKLSWTSYRRLITDFQEKFGYMEICKELLSVIDVHILLCWFHVKAAWNDSLLTKVSFVTSIGLSALFGTRPIFPSWGSISSDTSDSKDYCKKPYVKQWHLSFKRILSFRSWLRYSRCSVTPHCFQLPENQRQDAYNDLCALMRSWNWKKYQSKLATFKTKFKDTDFLKSFLQHWDCDLWKGMEIKESQGVIFLQ